MPSKFQRKRFCGRQTPKESLKVRRTLQDEKFMVCKSLRGLAQTIGWAILAAPSGQNLFLLYLGHPEELRHHRKWF